MSRADCAANHGLIDLTRGVERELARTGVTGSAVCPGYTDTDIVADAVDNTVAKTGGTRTGFSRIDAHILRRRLVSPVKVAEAVGWPWLPSAASITG